MLHASFSPRGSRGNRLCQLDVVVLYGDRTGARGEGAAAAVAGREIAEGVGQAAVNPVADNHASTQGKFGESVKCTIHFFILSLANVHSVVAVGDNGSAGDDLCRNETFEGRLGFVTYVIAQPCVDVKDKACVEECPVDCIYEGERSLYIHPDECVDCGACEPVCPVEAIYYEDDTPDEWAEYYKANVEFFDVLGSPGGAAKVGNTHTDHPFVAALPPQNQD